MDRNTNYIKTLIWISISFFALFIIFSFLQWFNLNNNIAEIKEQNKSNFERKISAKDYSTFRIEFTRLNGKQVIINPVEIEKINNHINALTEEVQKESSRAESSIDTDLNRLNLYMAIGIGFMTLLGIFVPILINVLSVQDLRDKQTEISEIYKRMKPQLNDSIMRSDAANLKSDAANLKSAAALLKSKELDTLTPKINAIEEKTERLLPEICNLILQNAIARFFNISPIVLTNAIREQNFQDFIHLLTPIRDGLNACNKDRQHKILGNANFEHTIKDFILFLKTESFRFQSVFNSRAENNEFEKLILLLYKLQISSPEKEDCNYIEVSTQINKIIEIFKNRNVKNKSAA
jgi:hypothetical protein